MTQVTVSPVGIRRTEFFGWTIVASLGMVLCIYGVVRLHVWPTLFGIASTYMGKSWFLDRMVWLYEDMKDTHPEYREWLY